MDKNITRNTDAYDIWGKYVKTPLDDRQQFVKNLLKEDQTEESLRVLMFYFKPDNKAYLKIFRDWVVKRIESMEKMRYHMVSDILDNCHNERTEYGTDYDVEKATIAYGTIISFYPEWGLDLALNPHIFEEKTQNFQENLKKLLDDISKNPLLVSFSVPMGFTYNEEENEIQYIFGYPQEDLRKLEREYLLLNNESLLVEKNTPLKTTLSFSDDGRTAHFDFFVTGKMDQEDHENAIHVAESWLRGQLSDGFGEDLNRYMRLIGHHEMMPRFNENQIRQEYHVFNDDETNKKSDEFLNSSRLED